MIFATLVFVVLFALLAMLLWTLAVHALPLWMGFAAASAAWSQGWGLVGAGLAGVVAACATLVIGRLLLWRAQAPLLRAGVGALFALPAALAGFHVAHGLAVALIGTGTMVSIAPWGCAILVSAAAWTSVLGESQNLAPRPWAGARSSLSR